MLKMDALRDKNLLDLYMRQLDDEADIISFCSTNQYFNEKFCTPEYLQSFLERRYPGVSKYKFENETWRQFFLRLSFFKGVLRENYAYNYTGGDFENQIKMFNLYRNDPEQFLLIAATDGDVNLVKYILNTGVEINETVLRLAVGRGNNLDVVKILVEKGADIHALDEAALLAAVQRGNLDIVKYLVEKGANLNVKNGIALLVASEGGNLDIVKYLVEKGIDIHVMNDEALVKAAQNGYIDIVAYLLDQGLDIHTDNEAALIEAAAEGHLDTVIYLVERGADIYGQDNKAYNEAVKYKNKDVVNYLKRIMKQSKASEKKREDNPNVAEKNTRSKKRSKR